ncbi:MAG: hypothetical protein QOF72_1161 [Blastocatellia bacterium]|jgi:hypothetical protein|nr:hypothetical protein [Blastocatellia bacterium]
MFFRLVWRLTRRNFGLHYFWPFAIAIGVESLLAYRHAEWHGFWNYWFSLGHLAGLASVYLSFVWVIAIYVKKASDVRSTVIQTLDDILPDATRYLGIGTIPLKSWFDPDSQVYLATIIAYQHLASKLKHERVLLFYSDYEMQALKASYLDEHHARSLLAIHKKFDITLGFLGPVNLLRILKSLSEESKRSLGCYRRFSRVLPSSCRKRRRPALLPFALIEMKDGPPRFLKFKKDETVLRLDEISESKTIAACAELVSAIETLIYVPGTNHTKLKHEFDFHDLLCP